MKTTCGIFLFRKDGKFLIGHPTNHEATTFSIPKGLKNLYENDFLAAVRELYEETNIDLSKYTFTVNKIGDYIYSHKNKFLVAFKIEIDSMLEDVDIKCDSMVRRKGIEPFPEIDSFKWVSIDECLAMDKYILNSTQIEALKEL